MHVILVKNKYGDSRFFSMFSLLLFFAFFTVLIVVATYYLIPKPGNFYNQQLVAEFAHKEQQLKQKNLQLQLELEKQNNQSELTNLAFTLKLARLQSQMTRLNVLGSQLVANHNLSSEFDFTKLPAQGGPQELSSTISSLDHCRNDINQQIDKFDQQLAKNLFQLDLIDEVLSNISWNKAKNVGGRPIAEGSGWLSSDYGKRFDPFTNKPAMHKGVDYAAREGTDIIATGAGVITWAGKRSGYGNLVEVSHGNGLATRYGHAKEVLVQTGDLIEKGQVIALVGNTGRSTGAHLHYEVLKNGKQVNPSSYLVSQNDSK